MKRRFLFVLWVAVFLLVGPRPVAAASSLQLAWDASPDATVIGYVLRYGTGPLAYTNSLDVGLQTTALVGGLVSGQRYYFAVQAYTASGVLSALSVEVSAIAGEAPVAARIISPVAGSTLSGSAATFQWDRGFNVSDYWLDIGSAQGGYDLLSQYQGTSLSQIVTGLPIQGQSIWVRLYSRINGQWQFVDQMFRAASLVTPATIMTPAAGTRLLGTSVQFTWSGGAGVTDYWLDVGTAQGGYDIVSQYQGTATSTTVTSLPVNGQAVWARLYSRIGNAWQFRDFQYLAAEPGPARIVSPAQGSAVTRAISLEWSEGTGDNDFWLDVGTVRGGYDIYSAYQGRRHRFLVNGIPENQQTVWVRLYSRIGGVWQFEDFSYATPRNDAPFARIVGPASGVTLDRSLTLNWLSGTASTDYWLDVGTTRGAYEILSQYQGTNLSADLSAFSLSTGTIWVRLYSRVAGVWQFVDYAFSVP